MSVDSRGVPRGCCKFPGCSCFGYDGSKSNGGRCDRCGHPPPRHANTSMMAPVAQPTFVVMVVGGAASDDDDEAGSLSLSSASTTIDSVGMKRIVDSTQSLRVDSSQPPAPSLRRPSPRPRRSSSPAAELPPPIPTHGHLPIPRNAWSSTAVPLLTCQYPYCQNPQFFDLNTSSESMYCSEHINSPPPPFLTMAPPDQSMGMSTVVPDGMMGYHFPPPKLQQFPPQQTDFSSLFTPPRPFLPPSQSAPSFQTDPSRGQVVQATPAAAPALLPEGERCIYPLCNKSRYKEADGRVHKFCGRYHAGEYKKIKGETIPPEMKCKTPGCTRQKRARDDGGGYFDYCGKSCRDGSFRTTPASPGEKCSLPGCDKPKFVDPANGRVHDYCGIRHANQAIKSGGAAQVCSLRLVNSRELSQIQAHFKSQWAKGKGPCPTITCAFEITNQQLEARWGTYKQSLPQNSQYVENYYHGTKLNCDIANSGSPCNDNDCGICGISKFGMFRKFIRRNINFQRFGHGFYFSPNSSKCHDYTQGIQTHRAMLRVEIMPGKKHVILSDDVKLTKPPDGCHSVFGKPGQALNYAELVVYNPDCVMPRYIIVYVHNGVHKIAK